MNLILFGQLAIPVALVAWMLIRPPRSAVGIASQLLGSLFALDALRRLGVWLFPPWWVPHLAAAVVVVGALRASRQEGVVVRPRGWLAWTRIAWFVGLGAVAGLLLVDAHLATRMPDEAHEVELAFPLGTGRYLVVNGGAAILVNAHRASMDTTNVRLRPWRGNGHAVDLVATDAFGIRATGVLPAEPSRYEIFGAPVLAPCSGSIVWAVGDLPDMLVPEHDRANMAGNHVILDCQGIHVVLAHLRQCS